MIQAICYVLAGIAILVIAILWISMPGLIMGTNKRLDKIHKKLEQLTEALNNLEIS